MLLNVTQSGRDIHLALTDNGKRELYAEFVVVVRDSQIVRYEFNNIQLLANSFQDVCRFVCGLWLLYLKRSVGKSIDYDLDVF